MVTFLLFRMSMGQSLPRCREPLQFLKQTAQSAVLPPPGRTTPAALQRVYVLGNPSADLDSIISAIVYSYFASFAGTDCCTSAAETTTKTAGNATSHVTQQYIPVINLPDVATGKELQRLRPEFVTALSLAFAGRPHDSSGLLDDTTEGQALKESILTVANLTEALKKDVDHTREKEMDDGEYSFDVMLIDWNALPKLLPDQKHGIEGISNIVPGITISITGCIDHHEDESFVPPKSKLQPYGVRCIQTGVGSCTSLVVRELREKGLWPENSPIANTNIITHQPAASENAVEKKSKSPSEPTYLDSVYEVQMAKLALAAVLIDTANMTAESKVSDTDRIAVSFLENKINNVDMTEYSSTSGATDSNYKWDRDAFYNTIAHAKESSVDNLTVEETLGRDYKEWTDTLVEENSEHKTAVTLGVCSVVKPISWLLDKVGEGRHNTATATALDSLCGHLKSFGRQRNLDAIALMTAFNTADNVFRRELLLYVLNKELLPAARRFEEAATPALKLENWENDREVELHGLDFSDKDGYRHVWQQIDVSKSRKQVAPLLRKIFSGAN